MAERLTADEAWNTLHVASGSNVWHLLSLSSKSDVDRWFTWLRDRLALEVRAEIDPQLARANRERDEARRERDALAARVKELEDATAKPAPKPRRTGGQKVRESLEYHAGHSGHDISDEAFALFAMEWGIPDEPEPPSDGELMRRAYGNGYLRDGDLWVGIADEFLKLRAERDGGGA